MSKEHNMKLDDPHYDNVKNGSKIYEIRVNDPKRQKMNIDDVITIKHNSDSKKEQYKVVITDKKIFDDFKDAIKDSGIKNVLPNVSTINEGVKLYESFPHMEGSYKKGAKKFGVVRFKLEFN